MTWPAGGAATAAGASEPRIEPEIAFPIIEPAIEPAIDEPKVPIMLGPCGAAAIGGGAA